MQLDLAVPKPSDDLGRTAAMFLVNAVVVGLVLVMAAEATDAMGQATTDRSQHYRHLHKDAQNRRRGPISVDATPTGLPRPVGAAAFAPPVTPES